MCANYSIYLCDYLNIYSSSLMSQDLPDYEGGYPDGCTTITVGKSAMSDGSVVTSHTCDSHRTRAGFDIMPAKDHDHKFA